MKKQLRNCSAYVVTETRGFCTYHELVSYATPVCLLGMVDGEIIDANGEVHYCEGMALLVDDDYDCSVTTMGHVRKFCEDYLGIRITIADIRKALATDNMLDNRVNVYHVDCW